MKKTIFTLLIFLSLLSLAIRFGSTLIPKILDLSPKAGLRVEANAAAQVSLDNKSLGSTPVQKDDLSAGEHQVKITSSQGDWQGYVNLNAGTLTVVNRELAQSLASSSGEVISLEKGSGANITSSPEGADVMVDGKGVGKSPVSLNLDPGEHLFQLNHQGYLERSIRAVASGGYSLNIAVDLALSEVSLQEPAPTPSSSPIPQVVVLQTPTGFLNVRDVGGINGALVEQISSGQTLTLEEEGSGWDKVKLPDGKEGYVSTQYIKKL